jgi:AraC-like DNA-binding protein
VLVPHRVSRGRPVDGFDFEGDGDDAREWLDTSYGTSLGLNGEMGTVRHHRRTRGAVAFDRLRIESPVRFDAEAMPTLVVVDVLAGEVEYTRRSINDRARRGSTVLASGWGMPFTGGGNGYDVRNTSITVEALTAAIADLDPDRTAADVSFSSFVPRSRAAAAQWRAVVDQLDALPDVDDHGMADAELSRLLAHTLLTTFDNNIVRGQASRAADTRDATHATVRRAQHVIDDRAHDDLSMSDLARECAVTPRALQYAFRRHLDCTPSDYLKQVRLDLVHQVLTDGSEPTVGEAATRFGFFNPGRFASEYRRMFGENPRDTLARRTS